MKLSLTLTHIKAVAKESLQGFARNTGLKISEMEAQTFVEDVISYVRNEGMTPTEAAEVAWAALRLCH